MILRVFFDWGLLGRSWGSLGRSWALLGRSWGTLVASWGALGALLAPLGTLLERLGALLGPFWAHLGPSLRHLGENIETTSRGLHFGEPCWDPKWKPKSSKIVYQKQYAFQGAILTILVVFSHFVIPADGDMCRANPYKTLAGRTKIEFRLGQAGRIAFTKSHGQHRLPDAKTTRK